MALLFTVTQCHKRPTLQVKDLKFANDEKEILAANQFTEVFAISKNAKVFSESSDTVGHRIYDKHGNLLIEYWQVFGGHYLKFDYDSNQLVVHKIYSTDYDQKYSFQYSFLPAKRTLFHYFFQSHLCYTNTNRFDAAGRLIEFEGYEVIGTDFLHHVYITYTPFGKLHQKTVVSLTPKARRLQFERDLGRPESTENVTTWYYNNQKIDSMVKIFYYESAPQKQERQVTYFNQLQLPDYLVEKDTLVTHFVYGHNRSNWPFDN